MPAAGALQRSRALASRHVTAHFGCLLVMQAQGPCLRLLSDEEAAEYLWDGEEVKALQMQGRKGGSMRSLQEP